MEAPSPRSFSVSADSHRGQARTCFAGGRQLRNLEQLERQDHRRAVVIVWLAGSNDDADELCEPYDGDDLESWRVGPAVVN
jgi:hypothetical protein